MPDFKNILYRLSAPRINYQPLIEIRISESALLHNLNEFRAHYPDVQFAPVIKSNAYGHGMTVVANGQETPVGSEDEAMASIKAARAHDSKAAA